MKNFSIKITTVILAISTLLAAFATLQSCGDSTATDENTTGAEVSDTLPESVQETLPEEPAKFIIDTSTASEIKIIRNDDLPNDSKTTELFVAFRKKLGELFSANFSIGTDFVMPGQSFDENAPEILIGDTLRPLSTELNEKIAATGKDAFGIMATGTKLAVSGTSFYMIYKGLDYLFENMVSTNEKGEPCIAVDNGFCYISEFESAYPSPDEVINSGRAYSFYTLEKIVEVPTKGDFATLQGGGSDGKYAYYAMINKTTTPETALIYKYDMATWELVGVSEPINSAHSNDITYDSKNHRLVISYCSATDGWRGLVFVNPDTLEFIEYIIPPTANRGVTYLPETNQYILAASYTFNLTNDKFETISSFQCGDPQYTTQGFYSDGKYIYDPRWISGQKVQKITINSCDGKYVGTIPLYDISGEPENIFRDGNTFIMGCNKTDSVYRLVLMYDAWW